MRRRRSESTIGVMSRNAHIRETATVDAFREAQRQAAVAAVRVAGHTMAAGIAALLRGIQDASAMALVTPPEELHR